MKAAQRSLLRRYLKNRVVIEIELGRTKHYPAFQFRDGTIVDALADINQKLATACSDADPALLAAAQLDWWQTPHPGLPKRPDGSDRSPVDLLRSVPELDFDAAVEEADPTASFVAPSRGRTAPGSTGVLRES